MSEINMASALMGFTFCVCYVTSTWIFYETNTYIVTGSHSASGSHVVLCLHKIKQYPTTPFER